VQLLRRQCKEKEGKEKRGTGIVGVNIGGGVFFGAERASGREGGGMRGIATPTGQRSPMGTDL